MKRARMLTSLSVLAAAGLLAATYGATTPTDHATARAELCRGSVGADERRYLVMANVWGADTEQCLDVDTSTGAFQVARSEHANGANVAAYPAIYTGCHWGTCSAGSRLPARVDRLGTVNSSWSFRRGGATGTWNAAYDLWFHTTADANRSPDGAELMIWLDHTPDARPKGNVVARGVRIGDTTWDVSYANWDWNHVVYVRTSPTSSVRDLDLRAFIRDATQRGYLADRWFLSGIEAGFELWTGGAGLASESFSTTVRTDARA
ncbi:glycoside hydrolase [Actinomycetes bacterium KLBMP 9797]